MEVAVKDESSGVDTPPTEPTPASAPAAPAPVVPEEAAPKPAAPVMDVRPPQAPTAAPANEVQVDPSEKLAEEKDNKNPKKVKKEKPPKIVTPKKPRQPGVGAAIFATVVIVFGLAALAVYAYLKTQQ
ncbi:MAG: hypothetical protein ABIR37_03295 [Candidatus Saccharimonadales bacterium]